MNEHAGAFLNCCQQLKKDSSTENWIEVDEKLLNRLAFRSALPNANLVVEGCY